MQCSKSILHYTDLLQPENLSHCSNRSRESPPLKLMACTIYFWKYNIQIKKIRCNFINIFIFVNYNNNLDFYFFIK